MAVSLTPTRSGGRSDGGVSVEGVLFTGAVAINDGEWVDVRGISPMSIHVAGITTATVQIRGSNAAAAPANNTHGVPIGADITADGMAAVTTPMNWLKARVSAWTTGTISATLAGHRI